MGGKIISTSAEKVAFAFAVSALIEVAIPVDYSEASVVDRVLEIWFEGVENESAVAGLRKHPKLVGRAWLLPSHFDDSDERESMNAAVIFL